MKHARNSLTFQIIIPVGLSAGFYFLTPKVNKKVKADFYPQAPYPTYQRRQT